MAIMIATTYGLTTLRVSVRADSGRMAAAVELVSYEHGSPEVLRTWWLSSAELDLPTRMTADWSPTSQLPPYFVYELDDRLTEVGLADGLPLWLHLFKPYGFLGSVDWEGALVGALRRPLLRLPDFLERPRENRAVLDVALVCSEPVSEPRLDPPQLLVDIAQAVLRRSRRERTTIHLFADEQYFHILKARFANEPRVAVHDPAAASAHGIQERGHVAGSELRDLQSPWLLWIRDSMQGRSLDAVHFVAHGYLADQRPALALAESPLCNVDRSDARYVGVGELAAFLTQTGAWSAIFSSPPGNYSEAGLRLLADTLAQTRPGPVLYHRLVTDGPDWQLEDLYSFLYAPNPSPVPGWRDQKWFAYCQPSIVENLAPLPLRRAAATALDANAGLFESTAVPLSAPQTRGSRRGGSRGGATSRGRPPAAVSATPSAEPDLPSWVSAAQRYVEQAAQKLQRREERDPATSAVGNEVERTLQKLQAVVASVATKARGGRGGGRP
ncbi:hypothetical protein M3A49_22060 [Paraburkholderia sp. CNPSo 3076]|uniref:hypothetical protein n=1 Tax=Paraburkholderia sp. CNPSo 3076 TaxID=2940936 RepID=UPI0022554327|nr:hypothetical protein [Paraburkholderia sp. CNPSo 3076]MCX5542152.1 hypothetical protein [Paraburkholderia sp. CNPSo 3076]